MIITGFLDSHPLRYDPKTENRSQDHGEGGETIWQRQERSLRNLGYHQIFHRHQVKHASGGFQLPLTRIEDFEKICISSFPLPFPLFYFPACPTAGQMYGSHKLSHD